MKRSALALIFLAALPFAASAADDISWNYLEGGYIKTNSDGGDADGFGVNGSIALHPNFHVFGGYNNQEIDDTNGFDVDQWRVGVGYNHTISPKADLFARVAYEKFDAGSAFDADGYSTEVGVRGALAENFEGYALAGYEDFQQFDGEFYGKLGAQVKFNPTWGLAGDVKFADGDTQWFVGPRLTW